MRGIDLFKIGAFLATLSTSLCSGQAISFLRGESITLTDPLPPVSDPYNQIYNRFSVASGDFNGDGKADVLVHISQISYGPVGSNFHSLVLYLGNGDGTFQRRDLPEPSIRSFGLLIAADFNGDKKLDFLVTVGNQSQIFLGNGDGTFHQAAEPFPGAPLIAADFTGDGKIDLLVPVASGTDSQCPDGGVFRIYPGKGDGTFLSPLPCSPSARDSLLGLDDMVVADFNGDGKLDVVWADIKGNSFVVVWLGNQDGTFRKPTIVSAKTQHGYKAIAAADINHDGIPDMVIAFGSTLTVLLGNGDGTFREIDPAPDSYSLSFSNTAGGGAAWSAGNDIFLRDLDGDGNLDILSGSVVFRGNGNGSFQPPQYIGAGKYPISAICEDLNGDGKADVVYLTGAPNGIQGTGDQASLAVLLNNSGKPNPNNPYGYSAASGALGLAQGMIASVFGSGFSAVTATASGVASYPTSLGGVSMRIRDSLNGVQLAPLLLVSPTQINFLVPMKTPLGPVTLTVDKGSATAVEGANATIVLAEAPGFFSVSPAVPAATAVRIRPDGSQEPIEVFTCRAAAVCTSTPIDLSNGPVYLSLYGTGFRNASSYYSTCQVGGATAKVQFLGPHPLLIGLDQLNLLLPERLPSGSTAINCKFVDSYPGNLVQTFVLIR